MGPNEIAAPDVSGPVQQLVTRYSCRVALITGATGGVGMELCRMIISAGISVVGVARNLNALTALATELRSVPRVGRANISSAQAPSLLPFQCDLSQRTDLADLPSRLQTFLVLHGMAMENIGIIIHTAGYGEYCQFSGTPIRHKEQLFNCNMTSMLVLHNLFQPSFRARYQEAGAKSSFIVFSSCLSQCPGPFYAMYHAAKKAMNAFIRCVSAENAFVDYCCVLPGTIRDTRFFQRPEMNSDKLSGYRKLGFSKLLSTTGRVVASRVLKKVGRRSFVYIGTASHLCWLADTFLPQNLLSYVLSFMARRDVS